MSAPSTAAIGTKYGVPGSYWAAGHHTGVDFLCPTGSTIKSPVLSKIIHAGPNSSTGWGAAYGNHVIGECVVNGVTYRWIVAHLRSVAVKVGQTVRRGMILGYSNSTGNVTGPHCHFEVRRRTSKGTFPYGSDVNPSILISITSDGASTDKMDPAAYFLGAYGPHITWLGQRLEIHLAARGLKSPYKAGPGPLFTEVDRGGVTALQLALGFRGKDADGFPGETTLKVLAGAAPTKPVDPPKMLKATHYSLNCGGYDTVGKGMRTAVERCDEIAAEATAGSPLWVHLQECSKPMLERMDHYMGLSGYTRLKLKTRSGTITTGKGRESYYRPGVGIKILGALLDSVSHTLDGDDKPFLMVAWERNGYRAVDVNFHNENQGTTVQKSQMLDVEAAALKYADKFGVRHGNVLLTGDTNRKESADELVLQNWKDAGTIAPSSSGEEYHSTNGWTGRSKGRRIDVDAVRYNATVVSYVQDFTIVSDHYGRRVERMLLPTLT